VVSSPLLTLLITYVNTYMEKQPTILHGGMFPRGSAAEASPDPILSLQFITTSSWPFI
jgi:hypothetical protein